MQCKDVTYGKFTVAEIGSGDESMALMIDKALWGFVAYIEKVGRDWSYTGGDVIRRDFVSLRIVLTTGKVLEAFYVEFQSHGKGKHALLARQKNIKEQDVNQLVPVVLQCPECKQSHVDKDEWAERRHRTHLCEHCKHEWRPFYYYAVGVPA